MIASQWISRTVVSSIGGALVLTPLDYRPDLRIAGTNELWTAGV